LKSVGIVPRVESNDVGKHLHDHLVFPIVRTLRIGSSLPCKMTVADRREYVENRKGPMSSNIAELGGFFRFPSSDSDTDMLEKEDPPDFQWHVTPTHYLEYPNRESSQPSMSIGVTIVHPGSRGAIRLIQNGNGGATNRWTFEIDPSYHSVENDSERLIKAVQWTRGILDRPKLKELVLDEIIPGVKRQSEDHLKKSIERYATTIYHYVGTCRMGNDSNAVVDGRFRAKGVEGLWVCDASTMPRIVSGNPQATVMMMAYRLSEWLN